MDKGHLVYEYNMLIIERTTAQSEQQLAPGKHQIEVAESIDRPGGPAAVILKVDGLEVARATVKRTVPGAFTASARASRQRWRSPPDSSAKRRCAQALHSVARIA